jgi:hypothetical protein
MLRYLAWAELSISIALLSLAVWPLTGFCSGRPMGFDCESWFIFGVNIFAPLGIVGFISSIWGLKKRTWKSQYVLAAGFTMVVVYMFLHI